MYYVEFLRVMRTLRVVGYILGGFLLLSIVLRPFSHGDFEHSTVRGVDPATIQAHVNADGTTTRSFTSKDGAHVTIVEDKNRVQTITIDEPVSKSRHSGSANVQIGSLKVVTSDKGTRRLTMVRNDLKIQLNILLLISFGAAALVATLLGLALSRENDGHLELAWTKPASRESYALISVALDAAAILVTAFATLIAIVAELAIYGGARYITAGSSDLIAAVFGTAFALSFYGIVLAATSSMRRGGLVLALVWPATLILPGLVFVQWMNLGTVARTLNVLNPVAYFYAFATSPQATHTFMILPNGQALQILAPAMLFAIGVAVALLQWRRLEA